MCISGIWLLVGLVRSHKKAPKTPLLCEDDSDLTSPTSNQIPEIYIAISVIYDTFKHSFSSMGVHIVISFILTARLTWVYFSLNVVCVSIVKGRVKLPF